MPANAHGTQFAAGKTARASVIEEARQRSGSSMARILPPNQVVTMEFNAQRLNLVVDAVGVVKRCVAGRCRRAARPWLPDRTAG